MTDLFPSWGYAVWINIFTSLTVAICGIVIIAVAHKRRVENKVDLDSQRAWVKAWIAALILFFAGRAIQVGQAGMTVAAPWFLAIGVVLSGISIALTTVIIRNPGGYEMVDVWDETKPDRRKKPYSYELERQ